MTDSTPDAPDPRAVSLPAVKNWLRVGDDVDDDLLLEVTAATTAWVNGLPYVEGLGPTAPWPADVRLGATMLAARMYRRRNTPSGVESTTDGAVYLPRRDSDVDAMLRLGAWAEPEVG